MAEALGAGAILGAVMLFINQVPPVRNTIDYLLFHIFPNERLQPQDYIEFYTRGLIDHDTTASLLTDLGLDNTHIDMLLKRRDILFSPNDVLDLYRRGSIERADYLQRIDALGISKDRRQDLENITQPLPSIQDLTVMAFRHAFEPDFISLFGLQDEFPPAWKTWAAKLGLSDDVQMLYWISHWHIPSFQEAVTMYQRGIIDHDTVVKFMRDLDLPPYWREKMLKMSYNPVLRTDIEREYQLGVIDYDGVVKALQNYGYSPEDSANLAHYYAKNKVSAVKEFTEAQTLELYAIGAIDQATALESLKNLGYNETDAGLLLELQSYKQQQAVQKQEIDTLTIEYQNGIIDASFLSTALDKLNLTAQQRQYYLVKAENSKRVSIKLPTKAELLKMFKEKIITSAVFEDYLSRLGYTAEVIALYVKLYQITDVQLIGSV